MATVCIDIENTKYPCVNCKLNCDDNCDCILCDYCTNWVHFECSKLSTSKFEIFTKLKHQKYMCKLCI